MRLNLAYEPDYRRFPGSNLLLVRCLTGRAGLACWVMTVEILIHSWKANSSQAVWAPPHDARTLKGVSRGLLALCSRWERPLTLPLLAVM